MTAGLSDWEQEIEDKIQAIAAHVGYTAEPAVSNVNVGAAHVGNAGPSADEIEATEAARTKADELGVDITQVEPSGAQGQVIVPDVTAAAEPS